MIVAKIPSFDYEKAAANISFLKAARLSAKLATCSQQEDEKMDTTLDQDSLLEVLCLKEFDRSPDPNVIVENKQELAP